MSLPSELLRETKGLAVERRVDQEQTLPGSGARRARRLGLRGILSGSSRNSTLIKDLLSRFDKKDGTLHGLVHMEGRSNSC